MREVSGVATRGDSGAAALETRGAAAALLDAPPTSPAEGALDGTATDGADLCARRTAAIFARCGVMKCAHPFMSTAVLFSVAFSTNLRSLFGFDQ